MNKVKAFLAGLALVSLFAAGGVSTNTAPAQAAPVTSVVAMSQGPAGYLTFWDGCGTSGVGFCGATWALTPVGGLNVCHAVPTGSNDRFTAFSNQSGHNFRVWTAAGCTGSSATLFNGTETGQLDSPFNNSISSQQRIS